jgi:hypothetical protein
MFKDEGVSDPESPSKARLRSSDSSIRTAPPSASAWGPSCPARNPRFDLRGETRLVTPRPRVVRPPPGRAAPTRPHCWGDRPRRPPGRRPRGGGPAKSPRGTQRRGLPHATSARARPVPIPSGTAIGLSVSGDARGKRKDDAVRGHGSSGAPQREGPIGTAAGQWHG